MKLQVSFDLIDLDKALKIATDNIEDIDIIEIGTTLLLNYGIEAIKQFKAEFTEKIILADTKIVHRAKEIVELCSQAGANWVTVMAGVPAHIIHSATTTAHTNNIKVVLDLVDASSIGQSALEAKNLGVDALLFNQPYNETDAPIFLDKWDMIKGNTALPVFVSGATDTTNINKIIALKPDTLIISLAQINSENGTDGARYFADLVRRS
jgi:3-hexulose-6-phosphate synthase